MRVLTQVPPDYLAGLAGRFADVEFVGLPMRGSLPDESGEVLYTWTRGAENLGEVLTRMTAIKWVHVMGTGVDEFPLDLLGKRVLTCARGAAAQPIAEWVLAMMLAFEKQVPDQWVTEPPESVWQWPTLGTLRGRHLAIVGFGSIGQQVARHVLSFGMNVRAMRRRHVPSPVEGVTMVTSLDELLPCSDHIVVAAPATAGTQHLLDERALSLVKTGTHLVNVARGSLVDQDALRSALDDGRIARASLDTTSPEPLPAGHWIYEHPSVRLSPHVSWSSPDSLRVTVAAFADNLGRWIAGTPLEGAVDVEHGY